jgi:hypothetical protein
MFKFYNLDVILAVGYRVRSPRDTQFRRWATERPLVFVFIILVGILFLIELAISTLGKMIPRVP